MNKTNLEQDSSCSNFYAWENIKQDHSQRSEIIEEYKRIKTLRSLYNLKTQALKGSGFKVKT